MANNFASDYNDVSARLAEFRAKHPDGSLQPANLDKPYEVLTIGEQTFIVYAAAAYRSPDDPRPGIGMAYESFPGKSNFTRGSELQNAETSAWGRAIVAALAADTKKGIASAEEVRNRQAERSEPNGASADPMTELRGRIWQMAMARKWSSEDLTTDYAANHGGELIKDASLADLTAYAELLSAVPV